MNANLRDLRLGWNNLGPAGAEALAQGVLKSEQRVLLKGNGKGNGKGTGVGKGAKSKNKSKSKQSGSAEGGSVTSNSLTYLDCQGNGMGEVSGCEYFICNKKRYSVLYRYRVLVICLFA
jgi:hypothetical protein